VDPKTWNRIELSQRNEDTQRVLSLAQIQGLQVKYNTSWSRECRYWCQSQWKNALNTKVQRCGWHQVNPSVAVSMRWGWGKNWLVGRINWCHQNEPWAWEILISHLPCNVLICKLLQSSHCKVPTILLLFPTFTITFLSSPLFTSHWADLVSPTNVELWRSCFVHWLWRQ
jgi:hypothetical protein